MCVNSRDKGEIPCLANIWVLAAIEPACLDCQPHVEEMRKVCKWKPFRQYYLSNKLTADQINMLLDVINERARPVPVG